jgi:hypothetical protein
MLDPTTFSTTSEVDCFFDDLIKKTAAARIVQKNRRREPDNAVRDGRLK